MGTLERQVYNLRGEYIEKHNGELPDYADVTIRWKDTQKTFNVTVALFSYNEDLVSLYEDEKIFFYFSTLSEFINCLCNIDNLNEEDFDTTEEFEQELNKYAETEEDKAFYFPSHEDFDIVAVSEFYKELL